MDIEYSYDGTSQGKIYFGTEQTTGITVVIKEYLQPSYRDLLRELYILSKIEKKRQAYLFGRNPNQVLKLIRNNYDGFPDVLGF